MEEGSKGSGGERERKRKGEEEKGRGSETEEGMEEGVVSQLIFHAKKSIQLAKNR
jgi:hypothetical protein